MLRKTSKAYIKKAFLKLEHAVKITISQDAFKIELNILEDGRKVLA